MFVTTFPCHYCARHIVAAGVREVQYIEPYAKSMAFELHGDSIAKVSSESGRVVFRPFTGVAPRLYYRAFLKDRELKNKKSGAFLMAEPEWGSAWALRKVSYVQLEAEIVGDS